MSFLKDLKPQVSLRPPNLILYGPPGVGKTTFANGNQDGSTIFFDLDDGLDGQPVVRFPVRQEEPESSRYKFKTYDEVLKAIEVLIVEEHDFKTLAIDTLDVVEQLIFNQVCLENNVSAIAKIKYGNGYKIARCMWDDFIKRITALRDKRKMTVVLICHALIKPYNDPMGDSYDRYILNINEKSQEKFTHWADAILFANYKVSRVKEDAGFSEKTKAVAERRVLFTTDHPAHVAKNRFNLPNELPLDWNAFLHHYNEFAKSKTSGNA